MRIEVAGCRASATQGFKWAVAASAYPKALSLERGATGTVEYTVAYSKASALVDASVTGTVTLANPTTLPLPLASVSYNVRQSCATGASVGLIPCFTGRTIPAATRGSGPGTLTCSFTAALPCGGAGDVTVVVTTADKQDLASQATPFVAKVSSAPTESSGQCAQVGEGLGG